jgi:hypothetical protein
LAATLQKAGVPADTAQAIEKDNASARINGLRAALAVLALLALIALALTWKLPDRQPGVEDVQPGELEADAASEKLRPGAA